jgi:hypothetical protein
VTKLEDVDHSCLSDTCSPPNQSYGMLAISSDLPVVDVQIVIDGVVHMVVHVVVHPRDEG